MTTDRRSDPAPDADSAEGNRQILERMVTEQPARLQRKMWAAGYRDGDADDLAQETLLKAVRSLGGVRGPADEALLCGWVDQIATNLVRNQRRNAARRPTTDSLDRSDTDVPDDDLDLANDIACRATLQSLLDVLPPEQQVVFRARVLMERSTRQVADDLGIPADLVRWRLRRARERLRARVEVTT
jgi:RNA polymerase sigma-70 factor (ECF subfamily)